MPSINTVGSFIASDPGHPRQSIFQQGHKHEVCVHIALTDLSPENGFYEFLRGSHQAQWWARNTVRDWNRTRILLEEGDAMIWRGDMSFFPSSRGGGERSLSLSALPFDFNANISAGIWQCLMFDWGPDMIDLTDEPGDADSSSERPR